jgi:hypothetical protein
MILGYAGDFSVVAGQAIDLHFSADADGTRARVHFYRFGVKQGIGRWNFVGSSGMHTFNHFPRGWHGQSWGWPAMTWTVPAAWKSGVYVAIAVPGRARGPQIDPESRRFEQVLFVVKAANPGLNARILYKLPFFTYAAYNGSWLQDYSIGATSLYQFGPVTVFRPGIGTDPWDSYYVDFEDPASLRQTFMHWDAKMIAWLERSGYAIDYCTDLDVHRDASLVGNYCLLLSVGHDEYWTEQMRAHVESFVAGGGNVAFFSGNTAWWRTTVSESSADLLLDKIDNWPPENLETRLTGVSYRHGTGRWERGQRDPIGYTVQHSGHWVFENTGLGNGAVFGAAERLVGYECDGTALVPAAQGAERTPSFEDGTPFGFVVLGHARTPGWNEPYLGNEPTMGLYSNGGIVFTAATTDWARVLEAGQGDVVQITRNVLDRLAAAPVVLRGPITAGACNTHVAVVGGQSTFHIANAPSGATIQWNVAGGQIKGPDDQVKVVVQMPATPDLVSIWVSVIAPGQTCPGFGTLTMRPLTAEHFEWVQFICHLRHLVIGATTSKHVVPGVRDRVPIFADPLWDPVRDSYFRIGPDQLEALRLRATALLRAIDAAGSRQRATNARTVAARRKPARRGRK